jgi:Rrf2 family protein
MLSTTSEYAIRALCHLANLAEGESVLGRELSEGTQIPGNYLAKILVALNKAGMVEASRGPHGGYRLRRPAEGIRLLEVATVFEGSAAVPNCLLQHSHLCSDDHPCPAHTEWRGVREVYSAFLQGTTIARIASGPSVQTTGLQDAEV